MSIYIVDYSPCQAWNGEIGRRAILFMSGSAHRGQESSTNKIRDCRLVTTCMEVNVDRSTKPHPTDGTVQESRCRTVAIVGGGGFSRSMLIVGIVATNGG